MQANLALGLPVDPRSFSAAFKFLRFMGVSSIRLASNNPNKISAASTYGIDIVERIEIPSPTTAENEAYIQTKRTAMGHHIDEHGGPSPHIRFEASVIGVADVEKAAAWYRRVFDMMILEQRVPETVHMVLGHSQSRFSKRKAVSPNIGPGHSLRCCSRLKPCTPSLRVAAASVRL